MVPDIAVLSTGGTIASTQDGDSGAASPSKAGSELVEAVPAVSTYGDISVQDVAQIPSFDMSLDRIAAIGDAAAAAVLEADDSEGLVDTVHHTDGEHGERYTDRWPTWVADPTASPLIHAAAKALRVGREHHGPGDPITSPGWPYSGVTDPPDLRELSTPWPWLDAVLPALWGVATAAEYADDPEVVPPSTARTVTAGPTVEQAPIDAVTDTPAGATP